MMRAPARHTEAKIVEMRRSGLKPKEIAETLGLSYGVVLGKLSQPYVIKRYDRMTELRAANPETVFLHDTDLPEMTINAIRNQTQIKEPTLDDLKSLAEDGRLGRAYGIGKKGMQHIEALLYGQETERERSAKIKLAKLRRRHKEEAQECLDVIAGEREKRVRR